jgi:hypothetical protein
MAVTAPQRHSFSINAISSSSSRIRIADKSKFTRALFLIFFARSANRRVDNVSADWATSLEIHASSKTKALPKERERYG